MAVHMGQLVFGNSVGHDSLASYKHLYRNWTIYAYAAKFVALRKSGVRSRCARCTGRRVWELFQQPGTIENRPKRRKAYHLRIGYMTCVPFRLETSCLMMLILRLLINAIALLAVANIVPGVHISSFWSAIGVGIVLGIVNAILRPVLILLSLPLEIITLGLFTFVINAALFWLVANFHIGLEVTGFSAAFIGSIVLSIVSFVLSMVIGAVDRK